MATPQKTYETSLFGNGAASTYWKHSSCNEREPPLPNMISLKPVFLAIARLRPNESTALKWKRVTSSQRDEPTDKKPLKPVCLTIARLRPNESSGRERSTSIQASCVPPPGCKTHPPGIEPGSRGSKPILHHYATGACPKWREKKGFIEPQTGPGRGLPESKTQCATPP